MAVGQNPRYLGVKGVGKYHKQNQTQISSSRAVLVHRMVEGDGGIRESVCLCFQF